MMDLDEAIQHCEEVADTPCFTDEEAKCYSEHRQLAEWLKELKAYRSRSEIPNKWIPVSERLPEENGEYLVTVKRGYVMTALWVEDAENWKKVTAWQPLPEPYKAESENRK